MNKITIGQFLSFTNIYVPIYIEDEFQKYECKGKFVSELNRKLTKEQKECPIDYIRNVDGGHFDDDEKSEHAIVLGIEIENWEKYFGKE